MATKYCDHGLYAESCVFTANTQSSGSQLTVTSVASGRITLGMFIAGLEALGLPNGSFISSFGTGTGGTGTYNLANATTASAQTGLSLTGSYGGTALVPTWGVAQDGDGDAIGAATPSTAEVVFTGIASAGVISVLGQTITFTRATSADVCANNLAAAINASTATAVSPASFTLKSQVRNHLYARGPANGAPAGTCQIMTRQGSAAHAGLICATHTLNNVSSPATINFAGGSSGAWGWIYAFHKLWPSAVNEFLYGLWGTDGMYCGTLAAGDVVNIRAGREVKGWTYTGDGFAQGTPMRAVGTVSNPVLYLIDDGTVWPADGAEPVLKMLMVGTQQTRWTFIQPGNGVALVKAKKYSDTKYGLEVRTVSATATPSEAAPIFSVQNNSICAIEGVHYRCDSGVLTIPGNGSNSFGVRADRPATHKSCKIASSKQSRWNASGAHDNNSNPLCMEFTDTIFDCGEFSDAPHAGLFGWIGSGGAMFAQFDACRFINFVVGSRLIPVGAAIPANAYTYRMHFRNCDFGGITVLGPRTGNSLLNSRQAPSRGVSNGIFSASQLGGQDFFVDTVFGWAAWLSTRNFPTLNAVLRNGVTPWSIQIVPPQLEANICKVKGFEAPRIVRINSLATGVRTLTVEFGLEQSLTWNKSDISMAVEYIGTDGLVRTIDTFDFAGGALTTSTAAWTNADGSQFKYSEAGDLFFNKYKLSITTPTAIATGTEIGAIISVRRHVGDTTKMVFIDPEIQVV